MYRTCVTNALAAYKIYHKLLQIKIHPLYIYIYIHVYMYAQYAEIYNICTNIHFVYIYIYIALYLLYIYGEYMMDTRFSASIGSAKKENVLDEASKTHST